MGDQNNVQRKRMGCDQLVERVFITFTIGAALRATGTGRLRLKRGHPNIFKQTVQCSLVGGWLVAGSPEQAMPNSSSAKVMAEITMSPTKHAP